MRRILHGLVEIHPTTVFFFFFNWVLLCALDGVRMARLFGQHTPVHCLYQFDFTKYLSICGISICAIPSFYLTPRR